MIHTDAPTAGSVRIYSDKGDYALLQMSPLVVIHFNGALLADMLQIEHAASNY